MDEKYVFSGLERDLIPRMYIYMKKKTKYEDSMASAAV